MEKKLTFTIQELVYYIFFAMMLFVKGMGLYAGQWPYTVSLIIGALLILVKLVITEHSIPEWIFIILMIALSVTIYAHSNKLGILVITATIIGMKGVSVKRIMWIGAIIWSFTFTINILLTLLGIRPDIIRVQDKLGLGYIIRYSLGSTHPNVLQISYMILCAFILYVAKLEGKKLITATLVMLLGSLYIFMYSVSYTGIVLCVFYLFLNLYLNFRKRLNIIEKTIAVSSFPFCAWFVIYEFNNYDSYKFYYYLNKIFNTRPFITWYFMQHNEPTLFGVGYDASLPGELNNLDSSFVYALMHYGIIFFVLLVMGYMGLLIFLCHQNRKVELGIVIASMLAGITEPFFINESFKNISWILLGEFVFSCTSIFIFKDCSSIKSIFTRFGARTVSLDLGKGVDALYSIIKSMKLKTKRMFLIGVIAAGLLGGLYLLLVPQKEAYIVNCRMVQTTGLEYVYYKESEVPTDVGIEVIGYVSEEEPMQIFDGNICKVEYIRGLISVILWGGVIVGVLSSCFYRGSIRDKRAFER